MTTPIREGDLQELLQTPNLSPRDILVLCIACDAANPKSRVEMGRLAKLGGRRIPARINLSHVLGGSERLAIYGTLGWTLTAKGRGHVQALVGRTVFAAPVTVASRELRATVSKLTNAQARTFLEEAVSCLEHGLLRAAVVLSWVGAIAVLYEVVVSGHMAAFNVEAQRRDAKWRSAKTTDDLARMKEYDFLQILEALSIIGKSVKQVLESGLVLRNGSGHPNTLRLGENQVAAHIEALTKNVFSVFY